VGWLDPGRSRLRIRTSCGKPWSGIHGTSRSSIDTPRAGRPAPELAAELVQLKVDVVFAVGIRPAKAAKQATSTIPIVIVGSDGGGSSGNVTGVTYRRRTSPAAG